MKVQLHSSYNHESSSVNFCLLFLFVLFGLGYRSSAMTHQRPPNVPSYCSATTSIHRPFSILAEPYATKPPLTRHRSLSNFVEHDAAYDSLFTTPHTNYPLWNDNYPASKFPGTYPPDYPARSLSQTNLPSRINSYDSQNRSNVVDPRKSWTFRSHGTDEPSNEVYWPNTPSNSSDSYHSLGHFRKTSRKNKNPTSQMGFRTVERWPKSLESLPKTPTEYRGINANTLFSSDGYRIDATRQPSSTSYSKMDRGEF